MKSWSRVSGRRFICQTRHFSVCTSNRLLMLLESIAEVPDPPATFHASHQSNSDLLGDNRAEIQLMKALRDRA